jgi:hydrogenase maturation protein HypF
MKNTFCLTRNKNAYVSQYIGDMDNEESLSFFKESLDRFKKYISVKPSIITYDLHPNYLTSFFARELLEKHSSLKGKPIQHHEAHIASVIAEHNINKPVIGFAFDGTGFGHDSKIWGGECFLYRGEKLSRIAHLENFRLPGGDTAAKEIWRLGVSLLHKAGVTRFPAQYNGYPFTKILGMTAAKINSPESSSMGRLFDAVASILDIRQEVTFEAQAAIEMESLAIDINVKKGYNFNLFYEEKEACYIVSLADTIKGILKDKTDKTSIKVISAKFHFTVAEIIVSLAGKFRNKFAINDVALSGGVFQNRVLLALAVNKLKKAGFRVFWNRLVQPNDGGISLGQAFLAAKE